MHKHTRCPFSYTAPPVTIYFNSVAYGYDLDNPPQLYQTAFATRQHARRNGYFLFA